MLWILQPISFWFRVRGLEHLDSEGPCSPSEEVGLPELGPVMHFILDVDVKIQTVFIFKALTENVFF